MMPVIAWNALHMSTILRESMSVLRSRCVEGIEADAGALPRTARSQHRDGNGAEPLYRVREKPRKSRKRRSEQAGRSREIVLEQGLMDERQLDRVSVRRKHDASGYRGRGGNR